MIRARLLSKRGVDSGTGQAVERSRQATSRQVLRAPEPPHDPAGCSTRQAATFVLERRRSPRGRTGPSTHISSAASRLRLPDDWPGEGIGPDRTDLGRDRRARRYPLAPSGTTDRIPPRCAVYRVVSPIEPALGRARADASARPWQDRRLSGPQRLGRRGGLSALSRQDVESHCYRRGREANEIRSGRSECPSFGYTCPAHQAPARSR